MSNLTVPSEPNSPDNRVGSTEKPFGGFEVAGGDRRTDVGAPDRAAIDFERRRDDEIEAICLTEGADRIGRSAAVVAECCIRRHQQARQRSP